MSSKNNVELRSITRSQLDNTLNGHKLWLNTAGNCGFCADLSGADLTGIDLSDANLRGAILTRINLSYANLRGANLIGAGLSFTDLTGADLKGAKLSGANLRYAILSDADLTGADLTRANLMNAILTRTDLGGADLSDADLESADLSGVKNFPDFQHCPKEGSFTAYKKVMSKSGRAILKLKIPSDARRVSSTGTKCRADKAKVLKAMKLNGATIENPGVFLSMWTCGSGSDFTYEVGKEVSVGDSFDDDIRVECAPGIHFFMTFTEARDYYLL